MLHSSIDHIAITAPCLEAGVDYVRQVLGISPQTGGEHPRMGTHNCVMKLGEKLYLEVIAVNPNAPQPNRPRWFELDKPDASQPIRLATWIARTNDIHAAAMASSIGLGLVESMSRGQMNWLITIPEDGGLPMQGIAPTLIQWPAEVHPADNMPDSGCALIGLEGFHPQAGKINTMLKHIGFDGDFCVHELKPNQLPYLVVHIQTPAGIRRLSMPG